jgi:hypothetical protein
VRTIHIYINPSRIGPESIFQLLFMEPDLDILIVFYSQFYIKPEPEVTLTCINEMF